MLCFLLKTAFVKLPQKKYEDLGPKTTDISKPQTKASLEQGVEEEKAPEKPEVLEEEKKPSDSDDVVIAEKGEAVLVTCGSAAILPALTENGQPCLVQCLVCTCELPRTLDFGSVDYQFSERDSPVNSQPVYTAVPRP